MTQETQIKLNQILSKIFGIPAESITDESSPDTIETWDSLTHINLVTALETEFGVSLTPEDSMEMLSVKLIKIILKDHGVKNI